MNGSLAKPSRLERLKERDAKKAAAKGPKLSRQRKERIENYGKRGRPELMTGPQFKQFILKRDGGKCQVPGCETPYWHCTAHHVTHVGAGGKNVPENGITLCANHHDDEGTGALSRETLRLIVAEKYIPTDNEILEAYPMG